MRYFGGKQRIAKDICEIITRYRPDDRTWFFEPFLGGANIVTRLAGNRVAADANRDLVALYVALQKGWVPPATVTKEEYELAKLGGSTPAFRAFCGFGCSFAGKWFGGYAGSDGRNYASNAANSLAAKTPGLIGVRLYARPYTDFAPTNMVIYCDPPYKGTTQYGAVGVFDSSIFWETMSEWASRGNTVLVSEYDAPNALCEVVWEKEVRTDIRGTGGRLARVERLFLVRP